jgi:hypothetical protein
MYQQHIATYRTAVQTLTQRATLDDANIQYLPKPAVRSLTEYDFLTAVINRNGPIRRSYDGTTTFVEGVWLKSQRKDYDWGFECEGIWYPLRDA